MKRLVYLSPVPWASFAQRPHHFVAWFHERTQGEVLWVDPYPTRLPQIADWRRIGVAVRGGATVPDWLRIIRPRALPIEPLPGSQFINRLHWRNTLHVVDEFLARGNATVCIGKPSWLALDVLQRAVNVPTIYDAMDDFPAFYSSQLSKASMTKREADVAARVSRILVSSTVLAERFQSHAVKTALALNACATAALPPVSALADRPQKAVIGYVGTMAAWFDWGLVMKIAKENPQARIRLVGPLLLQPPDILPANVALEPACDHAAAMRAMMEFSVGLIPFRMTPLTASVDPIKYYEYRALGLPVVSTRFGEMALRGAKDGVRLIGVDDDLSELVVKTNNLVPAPETMTEFRRHNSWEARFDTAGVVDGL